jgi:hypothetical protein
MKESLNEHQDTGTESNRQVKSMADGIGTGKKTGIYGCVFLVLAVVVVCIVLTLTGIYNPFEGTEGIGP